jgi:hypothetical protein
MRQYAEQEQASEKDRSPFGLDAKLKKACKAAQAAGGFSEELIYPYFELDRAHNMLVAGDNVSAGTAVEKYLSNQLMRTWRTLDEGGASSPGYWVLLDQGDDRYSGDGTVAMPHCWSLASLFSLMRDCIAREDSGRLILMSGVPTRWYRPGGRMSFRMPTEYGVLDLRVAAEREHIHVTIGRGLNAPKGCWLSLPNHKGPTKLIRLDLAGNKGTKPVSCVVTRSLSRS